LQSAAEQLAILPENERAQILAQFTEKEADALLYDWRGFLARPDQIAPDGDWDIWLCLAGRGWGKTETGAQWVREQVAAGVMRIALVAETQKDLEEVMVKRLVDIYPPGQAPIVRYKPVRVVWPNGAEALGYNGTQPDQLRGPEFEAAWVDELAKYRLARETWNMLQFCMRYGAHPRQLVTTTPRAIELVKAIISGGEGNVHVTRGKTMDNRANLAPRFLKKVTKKYAGTRLGRQELDAEILGDLPGALWRQSTLDTYRVSEAPEIGRTVIAIDPAVTNTEDSDEHGICVAGIGPDQTGYFLEDASMSGSPNEWAAAAIAKSKEYGADGVVVEVNQGGDMVAHVLRTIAPALNIIEVRASRGKHVRAEPIASLYEQGRIRHVGQFPELEGQMTQMTTQGYEGDGSPDRVDAMVWAMSELFADMIEPLPDASVHHRRLNRGGGGWLGA